MTRTSKTATRTDNADDEVHDNDEAEKEGQRLEHGRLLLGETTRVDGDRDDRRCDDEPDRQLETASPKRAREDRRAATPPSPARSGPRGRGTARAGTASRPGSGSDESERTGSPAAARAGRSTRAASDDEPQRPRAASTPPSAAILCAPSRSSERQRRETPPSARTEDDNEIPPGGPRRGELAHALSGALARRGVVVSGSVSVTGRTSEPGASVSWA